VRGVSWHARRRRLLYIIIRDGDGYMPSYAAMLDDTDRWAVVAYVRTLQLAQGARLARSQ
jgi:mono/diheme cytochrome c family protein